MTGKSRLFEFTIPLVVVLLMLAPASKSIGRESPDFLPPRFIATELLGRPTDTSVTVNILSDTTVEAYFEYGTESGKYIGQTTVGVFAGGTPIEALLGGLKPDTRYYYRLRYRLPGETQFSQREEHAFHTQRAPASAFTFTVQSDSHIYDKKGNLELYGIALRNQLADNPDFLIDLGDTSGDDHKLDISYAEMDQLHLDQRQQLSLVGHSAPVFLVLGNHEGEGGYYLNVTPPDNLAIYGTRARQRYFPNPVPNSFYSGNTIAERYVGLPGNYYAWHWGDALFVALDAYRHTTIDRKDSGDFWDWTLGEAQYNWLKQTLEQSHARFKFVFAHHLLGQARGAVVWADKYEWGGKSKNGDYEFAAKRPGWAKPIHQLLVDNHVTIFFQGHDHLYAREELDKVIYQETPMPSDATYNVGAENADAYTGTVLTNSGHLRVTVSPSQVVVDYVRAYRQGEGVNGQVADSYTITSTIDTLAIEVAKQKAGGKLIVYATSSDPNAVLSIKAIPLSGAPPIDLGTMTKTTPTGNEFFIAKKRLEAIASVEITSTSGGALTASVR